MELVLQRVSVALGFLTLAAALSTFATCRSCISFLKWFRVPDPLSNPRYRSFYRYHKYLWWAFLVLLPVHLGVAFGHTGIPQAGDPDSPIHWAILSFGMVATITTAVNLSSCRISTGFFIRNLKKNGMSQSWYTQFGRYHSYFWGLFLAVLIVHLFFAHRHVGFWPMPIPMPMPMG